MASLEATFEFCVELLNFNNVDLFLRGFVRSIAPHAPITRFPQVLPNPPRAPAPVKASVQNGADQLEKFNTYIILWLFTEVDGGIAATRPFRVLFRNEEVEVGEVVVFRTHIALEGKVEELESSEFQLEVVLCFNDNPVSSRIVILRPSPLLSDGRPLFFDYFHLAAISLVCHGGLIAIQIVKGDEDEATPGCVASMKKFRADKIADVLLKTNFALKKRLTELLAILHLPPPEFTYKKESNAAQINAENILLWHRFLDSVVGKEPVRRAMNEKHHELRARRWSEGFYVNENPVRNAYHMRDYGELGELLKKSVRYPPLPLSCPSLDGDESNIPLIFEERYTKDKRGCSCVSQSKSLDLAKLHEKQSPAHVKPEITIDTSAITTLPRRHSSSAALGGGGGLKKFSSTPLLTWTDSEESGWVSNDSRRSSDLSSDEIGIEKVELFVPPPEFDDIPPPPEQFRDIRPKFSSLQIKRGANCEIRRASLDNRPYFGVPDELRVLDPFGLHLIIFVHGLDGSCQDLRLFRVYLEVSLPGENVVCLMSEKNSDGGTFSSFDSMTDALVGEILGFISEQRLNPKRISFVGHSLGNIIIRSALQRPALNALMPLLHTFLSLSGPHLGTLYNPGIVNLGMWLMQKWKKSHSLLQLSLKDAPDVRETFLFRLAKNSNLHRFKYVLLCGSNQDRYVPAHSAHVAHCKASSKDLSAHGDAYREMMTNVLNPILAHSNLIRFDVHHSLTHSANSLIGRAAHIAVLDSEIFIEKFLSTAKAYFSSQKC